MKEKLIQNNSDELIIFLSGWGCDDVQFKNIASSRDVLLCWDYTDLEFSFDFSNYKKCYLIAFSAGVFVAGLIQNLLPKRELKIAVNGNPLFIDSYYGIPQHIRQIFKDLNLDNYMDFRREYLVFDDEEFEYFNNHSPQRTFESCFEEINKLENYAAHSNAVMDFDCAILSDSDKIFIPSRQKEYFQGKYKILHNVAHNVFYHFKNLDDLITFVQ